MKSHFFVSATFPYPLRKRRDQMPKGKPTSWSFRIKVEGKALDALNKASGMLKEQKTKGVKRADIVALFVNAKMTNAATLQSLATAVAEAKKAEADAAAKEKKIARLEAALAAARGETPKKKK
jgi:hypothetical protein